VRLRDFLAPERTVVPLDATTLQDAAAQLLERLLPAHGVLDAAKLRQRIVDPKAEDAIDPYVALSELPASEGRVSEAQAQLEEALKKLPDSTCMVRALGEEIGPETFLRPLRGLCDQAGVPYLRQWDTGALVLELCERHQIPHEERTVPVGALADADEAFLTSSTREVVPIDRVDDRALPAAPGQRTRQLADAFTALVSSDLDP